MLDKKIFLVLSSLIVIVGIAITMNSGEQHKSQLTQQLPVAAITDSRQTSFSAKNLTANTGDVSSQEKNKIITQIKNLHVPFTANQGLTDEKVKFYASTFGGTVFVTGDGEMVYSLKGITLKESLVGSRINNITGEGEAATKVSDFRGSDPSKWQSNIPTYDFVTLGEIYDGIELKLKAYGNNMEKLFFIKPEAAPQDIQVKLEGAKRLEVNEDGELVAETELGDVKFTKPIAYQEIDGKRVNVSVEYAICNLPFATYALPNDLSLVTRHPSPIYGFKVGAYDRSKELIIDPLLASTLLGGSKYDIAYSIAIDSNGDIYIAGETLSPNFPVSSGAYDVSIGSRNAFSAKLSGDMKTLLAVTFLGVSSSACNIAIDPDGNVYVSGSTDSTDFPATADAYATKYSGEGDAFIAKLSNDLTTLMASTVLGRSGSDMIWGMVIGPAGSVYVTGYTASLDFPTTAGAYATKYSGEGDAFIARMDSGLTTLFASTFMGGSKLDGVNDIALDSNGNVFVAGHTESPDFSVTNGVFDAFFDGSFTSDTFSDGFVSKFNGDLTVLLASTFLGGSYYDSAVAIAIDSSGNIYVSGKTSSTDFPTTQNAYKPQNGYDMLVEGPVYFFISKLNNELTTLLASTYLGGYENVESPGHLRAMILDLNGNVYVAGETTAQDFPITSGAYHTFCGTDGKCNEEGMSFTSPSDVFISKLDGDLTTLIASTYWGGNGSEAVRALSVDLNGNVYVTGETSSKNFPTTKGDYDAKFNGNTDIFIAKFDSDLSSDETSYALSISKSGLGSGIVTSSPSGLHCGDKCSGSFVFDKKVTLTAKPSIGSGFQEWGGACTGTIRVCNLKMSSDKNVTASFIKYDPELSVAQAAMDFGKVRVGRPSNKKGVRINNKGKGILTITGKTIDGIEFAIGNKINQTIPPKGGATIAVIFTPTSTGQKTATLTITSDDPETPTQTVTLKGTGK